MKQKSRRSRVGVGSIQQHVFRDTRGDKVESGNFNENNCRRRLAEQQKNACVTYVTVALPFFSLGPFVNYLGKLEGERWRRWRSSQSNNRATLKGTKKLTVT